MRDGAIGDIVAAYGYWVGTPVLQQKERDPKWSDMVFQHRAWYSFVWLCGDQVVEQHLHNIDVINWFMGTHPVSVVASGGAACRPHGCAQHHRNFPFSARHVMNFRRLIHHLIHGQCDEVAKHDIYHRTHSRHGGAHR